jgi:uncharacterized protein (DUF58 family)
MAVAAAAAGAPAALLFAVLVPGRWYAGLAWPAVILLLTLLDGRLARAGVAVAIELPRDAAVGATLDMAVTMTVSGRRVPATVEVAVAPDPLLATADEGRVRIALVQGRGAGMLAVTPVRRGIARVATMWLRWTGPLGLAWRQTRQALDRQLTILPDIRDVRHKGAELFERHAAHGLIAQVDRGSGTDFNALVEYRTGMDRRTIDWKQSARFHKLHAKEFHSERNSQVVFAIDGGRQMAEPVAGVPRVDRAVSAALLSAWVALKLGDRVALAAFDSAPRLVSGFVGETRGFAELQRLAATIDYSAQESNYTFALTTLATRLTRRSMVVLFTEFTDPTAANFLVLAAARLMKTHLLLIVVLRDDELEREVDRRPETAADVTRAITAAALLRDRLLVLARLRHAGAHIIESEHDRVGERLVEGYIDLKRKNLL